VLQGSHYRSSNQIATGDRGDRSDRGIGIITGISSRTNSRISSIPGAITDVRVAGVRAITVPGATPD